ncbi:MAG: hypothetical protein HY645_07520 [Acidobacteria bacterium]|nr:hypothetical protein [Acidobacteriota bacterium]
MSPATVWRLEKGYSRFLESSRLDLKLKQGTFRQELSFSPVGLLKRSQPLELTFRVVGTVSGSVAGLRWRLRPDSSVRCLVLFKGNPFLGNYRVPPGHFAVQWDVEAALESAALTGLVQAEAGTRLHHYWLQIFPDKLSVHEGALRAWEAYCNLFDAEEVSLMEEGQIAGCSWSGGVQAAMQMSWGLGVGWSLPDFSFARLQQQFSAGVGASVRLRVEEKGSFSIRVRRTGDETQFVLRRSEERSRSAMASVGVHIESQIKVEDLHMPEPSAARIISGGLSAPVVHRLNITILKALSRRAEILFAIERSQWKRKGEILRAVWKPTDAGLKESYSRLLQGVLPAPSSKLKVSGTWESVRGRRLSITLNLLNLVQFKSSRQRLSEQRVTLTPAGEILLEQAEILEKTQHHWDEVQFLTLLHRQLAHSEGDGDFIWTLGREERFSHAELTWMLRLALQCRIVGEFNLPARSQFPLRAALILATRFSRQGLRKVRDASSEDRWKSLVRSLEIWQPDLYGQKSFHRDWIVSAQVRKRIDEDPVQAHLESRYPITGRTEPQRIQVVAAYRKAKAFLKLLELWSKGKKKEIFEAFTLGMDVPIFVFFHLLCPVAQRSSAALLTGEIEEAWGDITLFSRGEPGTEISS